MPTKPIIAQDPDDPSKKYQLVNNAWVEIRAPQAPKVDTDAFNDAQMSIQDLDRIKPTVNPFNTGLFGRIPFNQATVDLQTDISGVQSRGALARIAALKQGSPTGANPLGSNMSNADLEVIKNALANFDTKQSTGNFKSQIDRAKSVLSRMQGVSPENPFDLSGGQSRTLIPKGAWYKSPDGKIRRNDNFDKGNPILEQIQGLDNKAARKKKYGLED